MSVGNWICSHCACGSNEPEYAFCVQCSSPRHSRHTPQHGVCVECGTSRTVCGYCHRDLAASGADGGSWVPCPHRCTPRPTSVRTPMQTLEAENASLRAEVAEHDGVLAVWRGRLERAEAEVARLRAELQNTVTTAYHDEIVRDAVAERLALRDAVTVAIHACTDVTRPGRFAPSVNPVRWVAELEAHLRDAVKA